MTRPIRPIRWCSGNSPEGHHATAAPSGRTFRLDITRRVTAFDGRRFDGVGTYDYLTGVVAGALNSTHPSNSDIIDIDKAPRNQRGLVEYETDLALLIPSDPTLGNGWLLYDVVNRGNKFALTRLNRGADGADPLTEAHAGDGLLMRRGFSLV